jgi:hypothetical protein
VDIFPAGEFTAMVCKERLVFHVVCFAFAVFDVPVNDAVAMFVNMDVTLGHNRTPCVLSFVPTDRQVRG